MINYYEINSILYLDFWRELLCNVPFLLGNTCRCYVSLSSLGMTVSQSFLACDVFWQFWRVLVMLYRMFSTVIWYFFSILLDWSYEEFWWTRPGIKCHLHHIKTVLSTWGVVKFLYYKITPFHPSHTVFFRRKSLCTADTWVKSYSAPWKWIIYINYLEFFCMGDMSLFPSIFIHLCVCVCVCVYVYIYIYIYDIYIYVCIYI